jgi:hypothetical protein
MPISRVIALLSLSIGGSTAAQATVQCAFHPEVEQVFVDCSDGSHFQAPINGGAAIGFDGRGHDFDAYVSLTNGRYSIQVLRASSYR